MPREPNKGSAFQPTVREERPVVQAEKSTGKDKAAQYRASPEDVSYRRLRFASWYLRRKALLQKIGVGILTVWSAATILWSGYRWAEYIFVGYWEDLDLAERQRIGFQNYEALQARYRAKDLQLMRPSVFRAGGDTVDFVTEAANPNEQWSVRVRYKYLYGSGETAIFETFFLPLSSHPIVVLGHESAVYPTGVQLAIEDIVWSRIDPHAIPDVGAFLAERLNFLVEDVKFESARRTELPADRLLFTLTNNSAYSYWQPLFSVALFNGNTLVGVVPITLEQFRAGEKREIDVRLFADLGDVTNIEAVPVIDVFDESVFMGPGE